MSDETLASFIRQLLEAHAGAEVMLSWQGGEPTLQGLPFFERALALVDEFLPPSTTVQHTLQTNGTLLNDEWGAFLRRHDFLVGISIDGPRHLHDADRPDHKGRGSFDRVMRGLDQLRAHGVRYNVLTTVQAANADHPLEVYRFLRDEAGAQFIQFIPVVIKGDQPADIALRSVRAEQYGHFLCEIFDEWVRRDVGRIFIQAFDSCLGEWAGKPPTICVHAPECGTALALEHNGDLYACDHFVAPAFRRGNIHQEGLAALATGEPQRQFGRDKRTSLPDRCQRCDVLRFCWGGCPKDRVRTADGEEGVNALCEGYRMFFRHVRGPMRIMAWLMSKGRAPSEITGWIDRPDVWENMVLASTGRNEACPCGSGERFKQCCGRSPRITGAPLNASAQPNLFN